MLNTRKEKYTFRAGDIQPASQGDGLSVLAPWPNLSITSRRRPRCCCDLLEASTGHVLVLCQGWAGSSKPCWDPYSNSELENSYQQVIREIQSKPHWDITSHFSEYRLSKRQQRSLGEDVENRKLMCTFGGGVNWCSFYGKLYGISSKRLKLKLPCNLTIPILDIFLQKKKH